MAGKTFSWKAKRDPITDTWHGTLTMPVGPADGLPLAEMSVTSKGPTAPDALQSAAAAARALALQKPVPKKAAKSLAVVRALTSPTAKKLLKGGLKAGLAAAPIPGAGLFASMLGDDGAGLQADPFARDLAVKLYGE